MKWKVGDRFIETGHPEWGIGTVLVIHKDELEEKPWFTCKWEMEKNIGSRYFHDPTIIPIEITESPLYQVLKEDDE